MPEMNKLLFGDHDAPALELARLFGEGETGSPAVKKAVAWGQDVIAAAGVDPHREVAVIHALRAAQPQLSLRPATYLASLLKN
ncbi:hypothetical protein [Microbacterium lacticum]